LAFRCAERSYTPIVCTFTPVCPSRTANAPPVVSAAAPKLKPPVVLGDASGVPLPVVVREAPPKLKGWLTAEAVPAVGVVGVVAAPAAATGAGVLKLKVLGEVAPAASGLPPKVKGVPPLGDATDGEDAAAAAPNENAPFPAAPEAAVEDGGVWLKGTPVAAASPPLEGAAAPPKPLAVGVVGVLGVVATPAAATGAGVLKLKVLGEVAPAASGLPPKVKGVPPLGDTTDGEGAAAAAPNENANFPVASEAAAVEGGGVWPKRNPVAAASPPREGAPVVVSACKLAHCKFPGSEASSTAVSAH